MRTVALAALTGAVLVVGSAAPHADPSFAHADPEVFWSAAGAQPGDSELTEVVQQYCVRCHNERRMAGNLTLEDFDVAQAAIMAETGERMIKKLQAGMMPPAGARRPAGDTLQALAVTLERTIDEAASDRPLPGSRVFQRLNRAEYEASIQTMLGLEIDAGSFLPEDTKSANFDNIADVQLLSPTLMSAYLNAASEVAALAVGDPEATTREVMYRIPRLASQWERADGAPYGSRGGISVVHNFPADGTYDFRMMFHYSPEGFLYGRNERGEQVEVSIDGERVALLELDRFGAEEDPGGKGLMLETGPISVRAGAHRVSAVFVPTERGPVDDLFAAHGHSIADTQIGIGYGLSTPPHMRDLTVKGPETVTGVSDTPARRRIFTCRPLSADEARPCAESIVDRLGTLAYRRPLDDIDRDGLMSFYDEGAADGGFEMGVRVALEAILASPHFVFRFEEMPDDVRPGEAWPISDVDIASRLSFFLWGTPPDEELIELARKGDLNDEGNLRRQTERMLADPRSEALATRFAAQWLRLQDLAKLDPDVVLFPDYSLQLADAMERETTAFFYGLVQDDRPVMELLTADYTYLNEALATHYAIPGVIGEAFRRVSYPDDRRRGILGHGSILTQTSFADRTSPVNRGKWVSEVLLGAPPPPPPPNVPAFDETESAGEGRMLTTRERMEMHRENPTCNSCHRLIDPIGLALDNFDVTGQWRIREHDTEVDVRGELYDGTPLHGPADLTAALVARPTPILRNFTVNLMAYALGRRVEYTDMPTVRAIVSDAEEDEYRISSFVHGVIQSDAFRMRQAAPATAEPEEAQTHQGLETEG